MKGKTYLKSDLFGDLFFDVRDTEVQIEDKKIRNRLQNAMIHMMKSIDAPDEEYERLGLEKN